MNGKRAKAIRRITRSRQEYQAGKRFYAGLGLSKSQNPAPVVKTPINLKAL